MRRVDASILRLAYDMVDTLQEAQGVGLAANQVGALYRIIVIQLPEEQPRIYINPEIIYRDGERELEEGCLSIPGYIGFITRAIWVRFGALDHNSKIVRLKADGLLSQALEHEVDHLNGILYFDHLASHETLTKLDPSSESKKAIIEHASHNPEIISRLENPKSKTDSQEEETPSSIKIGEVVQ